MPPSDVEPVSTLQNARCAVTTKQNLVSGDTLEGTPSHPLAI
jgi:hypothetical protein